MKKLGGLLPLRAHHRRTTKSYTYFFERLFMPLWCKNWIFGSLSHMSNRELKLGRDERVLRILLPVANGLMAAGAHEWNSHRGPVRCWRAKRGWRWTGGGVTTVETAEFRVVRIALAKALACGHTVVSR